jgi:arylsulfatase A-like enzyme
MALIGRATVGLAWAAAACSGPTGTCDGDARAPWTARGGNVLILVLDDVGVDKIGAYGVHPAPPATPNIDALLDAGVRFDRAYASPGCSSTRASILTGRHPSRHGIGAYIEPWVDTYTLASSEVTFAELARDRGYATVAIGKWHVSSFVGRVPWEDPREQGFDHFHGVLANLYNSVAPSAETQGYYHWERVDDGVASWSAQYATTAQADDAIAWMQETPEPWVLYLAFSAAHEPLEAPPEELAVAASDSDWDVHDAMVTALDSELGRVVASLAPDVRARTNIVLIGDNGTSSQVVRPPFSADAAKGTLTEGGIRVPLGVAGPVVQLPGSTSDALVHAVDVFATVADLVGADFDALTAPIDGLSLVPLVATPDTAPQRQCVLAERFSPDGDVHREALERAVVTADFKFVESKKAPDALTAVTSDPSTERAAENGDATRILRDEMRRYERALR